MVKITMSSLIAKEAYGEFAISFSTVKKIRNLVRCTPLKIARTETIQ